MIWAEPKTAQMFPEIRSDNRVNTRNTSHKWYDKQQTVRTLVRPFIFHSACVRFSFGSHKYYFRVVCKSGEAPADTTTRTSNWLVATPLVFWCDSAESTRLCTIKKNRFPFKQIWCSERARVKTMSTKKHTRCAVSGVCKLRDHHFRRQWPLSALENQHA